MSILAPISEAVLPRSGTALMPNAHEVELAAQSQRALRSMSEATGDLTLIVSSEGGTTGEMRIPASAVRLLFAALSQMACGQGSALLPLDAELRTQEAADLLNVSRPYLVGLLEKGSIPFRKVGVQRRVLLRDLITYKSRSDIDRRAALDDLAKQSQELGLYGFTE